MDKITPGSLRQAEVSCSVAQFTPLLHLSIFDSLIHAFIPPSVRPSLPPSLHYCLYPSIKGENDANSWSKIRFVDRISICFVFGTTEDGCGHKSQLLRVSKVLNQDTSNC